MIMNTSVEKKSGNLLGIPSSDTKNICGLLNQLLADEHILYIKMRNFHWNLVGPSFVEIHEFIEKLYNQTALDIDVVAERIQQLGHAAAGSMAEFLEIAHLKESTGGKKEQTQAVRELASDSDSLARTLRTMISEIDEQYDDPGTVDLLTGILRSQEKNAWMLRRYLG